MANDQSSFNHTITYADPPNSSRFVSTRVPIKSLNEEIMDVAFVKAVGDENYPGGLVAMRQDFRFDHAVALGEHWGYKYLLDLDGMSYSGRFMGFMASDSVVLKATVYREYFSDWIQPWCAFWLCVVVRPR
jgi:Glycosyl transferase family 90